MIKKVAESHALKKAFGISGIQSEYDFNFNDNKATPINTEEVGLTDEDIIQEVKSFKTRDEVMSFAIDNAENYIGTKKDIAEVVKPILEKM